MCGKCVIAELKTYFTEVCGSAKESVLHPLFFFIYAFDSDVPPFKKGPIQQCPWKTLQGWEKMKKQKGSSREESKSGK